MDSSWWWEILYEFLWKIKEKGRIYYFIMRKNATTGPVVSVRKIRPHKWTHGVFLSLKQAISLGDHPPSGPTKILIGDSFVSISRIFVFSFSSVWNTYETPDSGVGIPISRKVIEATLFPEHCSVASRTISWKRSILRSLITRRWLLSDRKNINSRIQTSTPFCSICSIFSYLLGRAW